MFVGHSYGNLFKNLSDLLRKACRLLRNGARIVVKIIQGEKGIVENKNM
jgi:hypothetical protein